VISSSDSADIQEPSTSYKRKRSSESDAGYTSDGSNFSNGSNLSKRSRQVVHDSDYEYPEEPVPVKRRNRTSKPQSQEKKDDIRKRNNVASRVYRSNKKTKIQVMESELTALKEHNAELQAKADATEGQVETMKKLVYQLYNVRGKK